MRLLAARVIQKTRAADRLTFGDTLHRLADYSDDQYQHTYPKSYTDNRQKRRGQAVENALGVAQQASDIEIECLGQNGNCCRV